ncbi:cell division protein FtsZ [Aneurinibacillus migulanus]|uniref:cell division protein FtsZ n=1 Tax=Aneurinibacillus migulanus TaxID=47500 RepID=UPI0005BC3B64|nr:cell division protein FtsZ [Aneurinibacillus migulanus]KIV58936.1 cell division protein FtsZ [Aneurinibacillus migulanus]KPD05832.1 cell division protein FtsZ [Aneurinibacillus migulanus]
MYYTENTPSIETTVVGFGQAGTRIVDLFADVKKNGKPVYNCLALNSNDGDLKELKHVPKENQCSLQLGGLGKNPEKAIRILEENENARDLLKSFIADRVRPKDQLVLFIAGLGGGTGTATIVRAIEEFFEHHNKPKIQEELRLIQERVSPEEFKSNIRKYLGMALKNAMDKGVLTKVGVIATIPVRSDGPDALRQVNDFAQQIWELSKKPGKGIPFVIFPDNQQFYDEWKSKGATETGCDNYRDYANKRIFEIFHELNTATNGGGTSVTFDSQDFKRIVLEGSGTLVMNKITRDINKVTNAEDIKKMFMESISNCYLHDPIALIEKDDDGKEKFAKVHHVGLLAVIDKKNEEISSSFLDDAKDEISQKIPLNGTIFTGYLQEKNNYQASVYTFYKAEALPSRLAKGLVKEYEEFRKRQEEISFKSDNIERIEASDSADDLDIDDLLADFGLEDKVEEKNHKNDELPADFDVDDIKWDDIKI